jgi:nucleotide-binding universal stress UspA family protein
LFKILAAVDTSRYASVVMDTVSRIASFTECNVLILTVTNPKQKETENTVSSFHTELIQRYFPQKEITVESQSNRGPSRFIPIQGATVRSKVLEGDPADTICRWADNENVDLVVLGKRGAGNASPALGSVSETVVHKCRRSVLVAIKERSDHANWDTVSTTVQERRSIANRAL